VAGSKNKTKQIREFQIGGGMECEDNGEGKTALIPNQGMQFRQKRENIKHKQKGERK